MTLPFGGGLEDEEFRYLTTLDECHLPPDLSKSINCSFIIRKGADGVKLTIKQKRFADEYIISGNATQAAINAGYKNGVSGRENLQKPTIKKYIDERLKEHEEEQIAKQDEILKYLTSVMRGEEKEETLSKNEFGGEDISKIQVSAKDRIKAAELLGKRYGAWTDKLEVEAESRVVIVDDLED